jgi:hypothetical protein
MIFRPGEPTNVSGVGDLKLDWRRGIERNIMSKFTNRFFLEREDRSRSAFVRSVYPTPKSVREREIAREGNDNGAPNSTRFGDARLS